MNPSGRRALETVWQGLGTYHLRTVFADVEVRSLFKLVEIVIRPLVVLWCLFFMLSLLTLNMCW